MALTFSEKETNRGQETYSNGSPVGWGCRIYWIHLCWGVRLPPSNECPRYDIKQSDGEIHVMLELHCHDSQAHSLPEW